MPDEPSAPRCVESTESFTDRRRNEQGTSTNLITKQSSDDGNKEVVDVQAAVLPVASV